MHDRDNWLLGIFLVTICILFDVLFVGTIDRHYAKKTEVYRMALKTTDPTRFNYIVDSHQGNVITNTRLKAVKKVKFPEMKTNTGGMAVKRTLEEYTMHETTTTDSKGNTHTSYYWTWDDVKSDWKYAKQITMFGRKYKLNQFEIDGFFNDIDAKQIVGGNNGLSGHYHYISGDDRYRYEIVPTTIRGTFIANTSSGTLKPIKGSSKIAISPEKYKDYLKERQTSHTGSVVLIAVVLVIVEAGTICYILCDDDRYFNGNVKI